MQADLSKERENKAAMKETSAKAVAAAKQHAADMSRDLEAMHDELEVHLQCCCTQCCGPCLLEHSQCPRYSASIGVIMKKKTCVSLSLKINSNLKQCFSNPFRGMLVKSQRRVGGSLEYELESFAILCLTVFYVASESAKAKAGG